MLKTMTCVTDLQVVKILYAYICIHEIHIYNIYACIYMEREYTWQMVREVKGEMLKIGETGPGIYVCSWLSFLFSQLFYNFKILKSTFTHQLCDCHNN